MHKQVILFDGVCNLCNYSVRFIKKNDYKHRFVFVEQQSDEGKKLIDNFHVSPLIDSVILLKSNCLYYYSSALVRILFQLKFRWKIAAVLLYIVPLPLRDMGYKLVAKNRSKLGCKINS